MNCGCIPYRGARLNVVMNHEPESLRNADKNQHCVM